jgi:hypothetical protein
MPIYVKKGDKYETDPDVEFLDIEKEMAISLKKHVKLMMADDWDLTLEFRKVEDEAAETEVKPEYRRAVIAIDTEKMAHEPEHIDHYLRHEILHIIVWNFFDIAGTLCYKNTGEALLKLEESVIDRLEHMPMWKNMYKLVEAEKLD